MLLDNKGLHFSFRNLDFSMGFVFLSGESAFRCALAASWFGRELYKLTLKDYYSKSDISRCPLNVLCVIMHISFKLLFISNMHYNSCVLFPCYFFVFHITLLKPTGYVMYQQFNIQQLYVLPTLYLCVLYVVHSSSKVSLGYAGIGSYLSHSQAAVFHNHLFHSRNHVLR